MYARFLKESVVADLFQNIQKNLPRYRNSEFNYLNDQESFFEDEAGTIEESDIASLVSKGPDDDPQNSEIVFNACALSRYFAADERVWVYLCHTFGLDYCRSRWPIPDDDEAAVKSIADHFFSSGNRGLHRNNGLSRLWWNGNAASRYPKSLGESLDVLIVPGTDPRAQIMDRTTIATSTVVFNSILEAYEQRLKSEDKEFFKRNKNWSPYRSLASRVNALGGRKLLPAMNADSLRKEINQLVSEVDKERRS